MSGSEGFARALTKMVKGTRFGTFKGAQPVANTVILPGPPAASASPDPGDLTLSGPATSFGVGPPIGSSIVDFPMLATPGAPGEGWVYAYEAAQRTDSTIPTAGTPSWAGADSWTQLATVTFLGPGTLGHRLTLWRADSGPGGAHTGSFTGGTATSRITGFVEAVMNGDGMFCDQVPVPADFVFQTLVDISPPFGVPGASGVNDDTSGGWCWIRFGIQRHAMATPLAVATGSGSGGAPTVAPANSLDPSVCTFIVILAASDHAPVPSPKALSFPGFLTETDYAWQTELTNHVGAIGASTATTAAGFLQVMQSLPHVHPDDITGL